MTQQTAGTAMISRTKGKENACIIGRSKTIIENESPIMNDKIIDPISRLTVIATS